MGDMKVDAGKYQAALAELETSAKETGYFLNPDAEVIQELVEGLMVNEERYGYKACPCRLAMGELGEDRDIDCPCSYRDEDIEEYGACYCALYVSEDAAGGRVEVGSIPDRRPPRREREKLRESQPAPTEVKIDGGAAGLAYPVWRCQVCGYLCALDQAPGVCPICKAKRELFERFL